MGFESACLQPQGMHNDSNGSNPLLPISASLDATAFALCMEASCRATRCPPTTATGHGGGVSRAGAPLTIELHLQALCQGVTIGVAWCLQCCWCCHHGLGPPAALPYPGPCQPYHLHGSSLAPYQGLSVSHLGLHDHHPALQLQSGGAALTHSTTKIWLCWPHCLW